MSKHYYICLACGNNFSIDADNANNTANKCPRCGDVDRILELNMANLSRLFSGG